MATQIARQVYTLRDAKGFTATMRFYISYSDASATTVNDARVVAENIWFALNGTGPGTLPISNAHIVGVIGPYNQVQSAGYGTAAQYLNCEDKLMVAMVATDQSVHRFGIPAPTLAAFLADQETGKGSQLVDFVNALVNPSNAAFACTRGGLAFGSAIGSLLIRRRQRRKFTLYSKSANLDEPGE